MTQDVILDRVRKLLRLAGNNPNAEEAAAAAAKAQALIDAHQLSRALLDLDTTPGRPPEDEPIRDWEAPLDADGRRSTPRVRLAAVVARSNGCRIYLSARGINLVGRASDAEAARYLYAWIAGEMDRLAAAQGRGQGMIWRNNFRLGVVDTVGRKLSEARDAWTRQARAEAEAADRLAREALRSAEAGPLFAGTPPAGALVRVNAALAQLETRGATVDQWIKGHLRLRAGGSRGGRSDGNARAAGRAAGEGISLSGGGRRLGSGARALRG